MLAASDDRTPRPWDSPGCEATALSWLLALIAGAWPRDVAGDRGAAGGGSSTAGPTCLDQAPGIRFADDEDLGGIGQRATQAKPDAVRVVPLPVFPGADREALAMGAQALLQGLRHAPLLSSSSSRRRRSAMTPLCFTGSGMWGDGCIRESTVRFERIA